MCPSTSLIVQGTLCYGPKLKFTLHKIQPLGAGRGSNVRSVLRAFPMVRKHSTTRLHPSSRKMTTLDAMLIYTAGVIPEHKSPPGNPLREGLEYTIRVTSDKRKHQGHVRRKTPVPPLTLKTEQNHRSTHTQQAPGHPAHRSSGPRNLGISY